MGEYYRKQGEDATSIQEQQKAIDHPYANDIVRAWAQLSIGTVYLEMEDFDTARHEYQKVLDWYPDERWQGVEALRRIADCHKSRTTTAK